MKARINTYKGNADIFYGDIKNMSIRWDGMQFDTKEEYEEWLDTALEDINDADNYDDIRMSLYIVTNHLCHD